MSTELNPTATLNNAQAQASGKEAAVDLENVRAQLLKPFPTITLRSVVIILIVVGILSWSLAGSGPSPTNRITSIFDPFIAVGNLIGMLLANSFRSTAMVTQTGIQSILLTQQGWWPHCLKR